MNGSLVTAAAVALAVLGLGCAEKQSAGHAGSHEKTEMHKMAETVKTDPGPDVSRVGSDRAKHPGTQKTCPVMGGDIVKSIYADHEGKRVYFCCPGCIGTFKKNPEKYLGILEQKGERPETR